MTLIYLEENINIFYHIILISVKRFNSCILNIVLKYCDSLARKMFSKRLYVQTCKIKTYTKLFLYLRKYSIYFCVNIWFYVIQFFDRYISRDFCLSVLIR